MSLDLSRTLLFLGSGVSGKNKQARKHVERQCRRRTRTRNKGFQNEIPSADAPLSPITESKLRPISSASSVDAEVATQGGFATVKRRAPVWRLCSPSTGFSLIQDMAMTLPHLLQHGASDPFQTTPVPIDATMNDLMYCSRKWYSLSKWSLGLVLHQHTLHSVKWLVDIKYAICQESTHFAALALACQYAARLGRGSICSRRFFGAHYKILAFRAVREELKNPPTSSIIHAILDLAAAEFFDANFKASVLHLRAVHSLLETMGGISSLDEATKDFIGLSDYVLSWSVFERPMFDSESWDPGPLQAQPSTQIVQLFAGIATPSHQQDSVELGFAEMPSTLLNTSLMELKETLQVRRRVTTVIDNRCRDQIVRWLHIRSIAIYTRLLISYLDYSSHSQDVLAPEPDDSSKLCAAVSLALRYCHSLIMYTPAITTEHFSPLRMFQVFSEAMSDTPAVSKSRANLFLWLYFVGAILEQLAETQGLHENGFSIRFLQLVENLAFQSQAAIADTLRVFLYDEQLDKYLQPYVSE